MNEDGPRISSTAALAKHLGLSRWTVSRVINGHGDVSPETVQKVRDAMRQAGFEPNPFARSLRGGSTRTIGVCIQELESPSLIRKAGILQDLFRRDAYHCLLELTHRDRDLEEQVIRHFLTLKVDGIVCIGTRLRPGSPPVDALVHSEIPVLLVDPEVRLPFPSVKVDRRSATRTMLELLRGEGHTTFGFAGFDPDYAYSRERLAGADDFFREANEASTVWSLYEAGTVQHDYEYGVRLAKRAENGKTRPDAVLCVNDRVAIGFIASLQRRGLRVPGDLAVVGHDNLEVASFFSPPLTTTDQQTGDLMQAVRDRLLPRIEGDPAAGETVVEIPSRLWVRESHRTA